MIARALSFFGLMKRAEHEAALRRMTIGRDDWKRAAQHWEAKFKLAATDLAAQAEEIASLRRQVANQRASLANYMPDAIAHRRKRANDAAAKREKRAARKGVGKS